MNEVYPNTPIADGLRATRDDDDIEGAALIGFVTIAEWMLPTGDRCLVRYVGDGAGDNTKPTTWQVDGYLHHGDSHRWPTGGDDEEDE